MIQGMSVVDKVIDPKSDMRNLGRLGFKEESAGK